MGKGTSVGINIGISTGISTGRTICMGISISMRMQPDQKLPMLNITIGKNTQKMSVVLAISHSGMAWQFLVFVRFEAA